MPRPSLRLIRSPRGAEDKTSGSPTTATRSAPPLGDAQLLAAVQSGDEDAAAELHDRLRPRVDTTIRALLGPGHAEADDLAQQSFVELVPSLDRYRGECALETWAATIAARVVFKFLRRRTLERKLFHAPEEDAAEPASPMSSRRHVAARSLAWRVREHLAGVDSAKAEAFLLHDVCGFDAREIAGIVGISEAAAHARIARGRRELKAKIAADPELRDALVDMEVEP